MGAIFKAISKLRGFNIMEIQRMKAFAQLLRLGNNLNLLKTGYFAVENRDGENNR